MVAITGGPRLPTVSTAGTGSSLPARVTGPRQSQNHQPQPVAGRAPVPTHSGSRPARANALAGASPSTVLTDRVRKSMEVRKSVDIREHPAASEQAADPFDQLAADLQSLSLQHAAATQQHAPAPPQPPQRDSAHTTSPRNVALHEAGLPLQLLALQDASAPVSLPAPGLLPASSLDNWKLDKLVGQLGKDKGTWRRAMLLFEWLKASRHAMDDRFCTTLIRVCSDHGDCVSALSVYDWMTSSPAAGGAALTPTTYTYTAAMRAALGGHMHSRALHIWNDAWRRHQAGQLQLDARLCITYIELCARMGLTDQALGMYAQMLGAPSRGRMAPTVHAFTAAMRAATEGGRWTKALEIWEDMRRAGCEATGHAYAAAISACAAGADWMRAISFFEEMAGHGIKPDVVSCTALISALATSGEADKAEGVVAWMLANGVRPNARTYTALLSAQAAAKQWGRAVETISRMRQPAWGGVEPNAYTYSALLKSLGEHGQWQIAEAVFSGIEQELLGERATGALSSSSAAAVPPPPPPPRPSSVLPVAQVAGAGAVGNSRSSGGGASNDSASSSDEGRSWTHPSQLHGLSLDLRVASATCSTSQAAGFPALGGGSIDSAAAFSADVLLDAPAPAGVSTADPVVVAGRKSFSLFSHPAGRSAYASSAAVSGFGAASMTPFASASSSTSPSALQQQQQREQRELDMIRLPSDPWRATLDDAAAMPLASQLYAQEAFAMAAPPPPPAYARGGSRQPGQGQHGGGGPEAHIVNEVVCGALMLAYERAGKWQEAVNVLLRGLNLGIYPNTVMYNTAISAAGKAGQLEVAEKLYTKVRNPDAVTHETMIAAYGVAGLAEQAESVFAAMSASGLRPRDYAYCGLIAAHSLGGDWEGALRVRARMRRAGVQPSVHVYNALLAACERAQQPDRALELLASMKRDGVEANAVTAQLLSAVGRQGVQSVESQQVAAAALSAAMAAYGTMLIQTGMF